MWILKHVCLQSTPRTMFFFFFFFSEISLLLTALYLLIPVFSIVWLSWRPDWRISPSPLQSDRRRPLETLPVRHVVRAKGRRLRVSPRVICTTTVAAAAAATALRTTSHDTTLAWLVFIVCFYFGNNWKKKKNRKKKLSCHVIVAGRAENLWEYPSSLSVDMEMGGQGIPGRPRMPCLSRQ